MTPRGVRKLFERARHDFFPRWDRQGLWRLRCVADLNGALGEADRSNRTITVVTGQGARNTYLVILHEICHAATHLDHGKRWQARLAAAACHARKLGKHGLARMLREEIRTYQVPVVSNPSAIYTQITEFLWDEPQANFSQVIRSLRRNFGLSHRDFLERYRRSRAVFDQARIDARQWHLAANGATRRAARTRRYRNRK